MHDRPGYAVVLQACRGCWSSTTKAVTWSCCLKWLLQYAYAPLVRNWHHAHAALVRRGIDLVLLDVHFDRPEDALSLSTKRTWARVPRARSLEALRRTQSLHILAALRERWPALPVIVLTSMYDLPHDAQRLAASDSTYRLDELYVDARTLGQQIERVLAEPPLASVAARSIWSFWTFASTVSRRTLCSSRRTAPCLRWSVWPRSWGL